MKHIQLSNNSAQLLCDEDDYEWLSQIPWKLGRSGYAQYGSIFAHRIIARTPKGLHTDHINQNKLDNQKNNLRIATHSQNAANNSFSKRNTSGFKGVSKAGNRWRATITVNNKFHYIGTFETPEEANLAYQKKAQEFFGEFSS